MKKHYNIIGISIILFFFFGILFQLGERVIHEDSSIGFSVFAFTSNKQAVRNISEADQCLEIEIKNFESEKKNYILSYNIDGNDIDTMNIDVLGGEFFLAKAPDKLLNYFKIHSSGKYHVIVTITHDDSVDILDKQITLGDVK